MNRAGCWRNRETEFEIGGYDDEEDDKTSSRSNDIWFVERRGISGNQLCGRTVWRGWTSGQECRSRAVAGKFWCDPDVQQWRRGNLWSAVAEAVLPSIVAIDVKVVSRQQDFFGRTFESQGEGSGSGILFKEDSDSIYIVTNNHVVADSVQVQITFNNETTANATVTGTDEASDLAVVKVAKKDLKDGTLSQIKIAELADSKETKVGEQAIAIGNALGYGTSVTVGYVSAKDRQLGMEGQDTMKLIQTDAAINPGNSGGALVNAKGEVIGINSSKFASEEVEGMGFAIPISDALPIMENLMKGDGASQGFQGGARTGDIVS